MMDMMNIENLVAGMGEHPAIQELFGGLDQLKHQRKQQELSAEAQLRLAQSILTVFNSEAGKVLFEYLVGSTYRRFENISAMSLPMETAIQLHAEKDGRMGLVTELLRLVKLAQNPPAKPKET